MAIKLILFFILLPYCESIDTVRKLLVFENLPCADDEFQCLNDVCIDRKLHCNGRRDCTDASDEDYCGSHRPCPTAYDFSRCVYGKCIPSVWKCDGFKDCSLGDDESNCGSLPTLRRQGLLSAKRKATRWLYGQLKNDNSTNKWGTDLRKISVALYLGDPAFQTSSEIRTEMAYELSIQFLSKFAFRKLKHVSTFDLASYTNALIVTCLDPRKFHSVNLVEELRSRADAQNYTNPYVLLTLCNAGEAITQTDIEKLNQSYWNTHMQFWTEKQAITVMALACAGKQPDSSFDLRNIKNFTLQLKQLQYKNGTVEDFMTTALVMQALFSSEHYEDSYNFDEGQALLQILREQRKDGSFGDIDNTYYALPILSYKTLVNVGSNHCNSYIKDEDSGLEDLINLVGPKKRVIYSLWIGNDRDIERILKLRVPSNTSFYGIMEIAGDIDQQFRFQYVVKNGKPYVKAMHGKRDDPESGRFWFLYIMQRSKPVPVLKSPADLFPKDNDHIIMWYRCGTWIE